MKLTEKSVRDAGRDKGFNAEADVQVGIFGRILSSDKTPKSEAWYDETWYSSYYEGTRRKARDMEGQRFPREGDAGATGGTISVSIKPDRSVWGVRETITGTVTLRNTGTGRIHLGAWWVDGVKAVDEAGKEAESFSIQGFIDPAPNAPQYAFLEPGETHAGKFSLYTDRAYSLESGQYLAQGKWALRYDGAQGANVRVDEEPPTVEIKAEPGEYLGPRIEWVKGAGRNMVVEREGGIIEVIDIAAGARLATLRPQGYVAHWIWSGSDLVLGPEGRMAAYCANRNVPITVERFFGSPLVRTAVGAPEDLTVGQGGFSARGFSADGSRLFCVTNFVWSIIDLSTGREERRVQLPEQWTEISPDGKHAGAVRGSLGRLVGYRGDDVCTVTLYDLGDPAHARVETVRGHGQSPELFMGAGGAYVTDEFGGAVLYVPYDDGPVRTIEAEDAADVVAESADGSLVVLAWPGWERARDGQGATTVGVYRVVDGSRVSTVRRAASAGVAFLEGPARIVCLERRSTGDACGGSRMLEGAAVYNATTGEKAGEMNLTPPAGLLPDYPAR